jgi:Transcriptional regulators
MSQFNALSRSNTVPGVLNRLRKDIILSEYKDGQKVSELSLSAKYNCSRTTVRTSLFALEKEGFITTEQNGTKTVQAITLEDIENLYDLREYIELTAISRIFRVKNKDIGPVIDILQSVMNSHNMEVEEILELDAEFHQRVLRASGNKAIMQSWENISGVLQAIFSLNMTFSEEYKTNFLSSFRENHIELFSSFMKTEKECTDLFRAHILDARNISLQALGNLSK